MQTYKYFPGGNTTLLIDNLSSQISAADYAAVAKLYLRDDVEQVGFIERGKTTQYRLGMMGGEFCINALRSLAMWVSERHGEESVRLESSGTDDVVNCWVQDKRVAICLSKKPFRKEKITEKSTLVFLEGIAHLVEQDFRFESEAKMKENFLKEILPSISEQTKNYEAVGYIGLGTGGDISPLVYVKPTDSLIYETACGSGTLAAFLVLRKSEASFIQPSKIPFMVYQDALSYKLESEVSRIT